MNYLFICILVFFLSTNALADLLKALPTTHQKIINASYIVFIAHGTSCPVVAKFYPKIKELEKSFDPKKVHFVFVNPSPHDSKKKIEDELKKFKITTDYIWDEKQTLSKYLNLKTTTQALIYDVKADRIQYNGAIDDSINFDVQLEKPRNDFVKDQLNLLLSEKKTTVQESEVFGCAITYK